MAPCRRRALPTQPANGRRLVASLCATQPANGRWLVADRPRVDSFLRRSPRRVDQATWPARATAPEQSFGLQPSQLRLQAVNVSATPSVEIAAALASTMAQRLLKVVTAVSPLPVFGPALKRSRQPGLAWRSLPSTSTFRALGASNTSPSAWATPARSIAFRARPWSTAAWPYPECGRIVTTLLLAK